MRGQVFQYHIEKQLPLSRIICNKLQYFTICGVWIFQEVEGKPIIRTLFVIVITKAIDS